MEVASFGSSLGVEIIQCLFLEGPPVLLFAREEDPVSGGLSQERRVRPIEIHKVDKIRKIFGQFVFAQEHLDVVTMGDILSGKEAEIPVGIFMGPALGPGTEE